MMATSTAIEGAGEQIGESSAPAFIQRYRPTDDNRFELDVDGEFVSYADHIAAIMNPSGQRLTGNDTATYKLIQHMLDTIVTAEQDPLFAGFQFQEMRTKDGLLLAVRLIACDAVGDIAAPRVV